MAERSTVTLLIGSGPATTAVPALQGKTVAEATQLLADRGLKIGNQTQVETADSTLVGKIVSSTPAAGENASGGQTVDVAIGIEQTGLTMANYVGQPLDTVRDELRNLGLNPQLADGSDGDGEAIVTRTSPSAGQKVQEAPPSPSPPAARAPGRCRTWSGRRRATPAPRCGRQGTTASPLRRCRSAANSRTARGEAVAGRRPVRRHEQDRDHPGRPVQRHHDEAESLPSQQLTPAEPVEQED